MRKIKKRFPDRPNYTGQDIAFELPRRIKWMDRPTGVRVLDAFKEAIVKGVAEDGEVTIAKFGKFYTTKLKDRFQPNALIPHRGPKAIRFKPFALLREFINQEDEDGVTKDT